MAEAEKRMFTRDIVESDEFLDMPCECQTLYFHLNMHADDYGFVNSPRKVMKSIGASDDSMLVLVAKKFVLKFQKGNNFVYLIKHWKMHNYIRKDRIRESRFKEFLLDVYYDENSSYSMNPGDGHVPCLPTDSQLSANCLPTDCQLSAQNRLEENRSEENSSSISINQERVLGETNSSNDSLTLEERQQRYKQLKERYDFCVKIGNTADADRIRKKAADEGIAL